MRSSQGKSKGITFDVVDYIQLSLLLLNGIATFLMNSATGGTITVLVVHLFAEL
jgi:hypothetical protein